MASDYAEKLANAVESIGAADYGDPSCGCYSCHNKRLNPKPAAENLATLEAWLREHGADSQEIWWEPREAGGPWHVTWTRGRGYEALAEITNADTEQEVRALAAMQAVVALLKETNNNV